MFERKRRNNIVSGFTLSREEYLLHKKIKKEKQLTTAEIYLQGLEKAKHVRS